MNACRHVRITVEALGGGGSGWAWPQREVGLPPPPSPAPARGLSPKHLSDGAALTSQRPCGSLQHRNGASAAAAVHVRAQYNTSTHTFIDGSPVPDVDGTPLADYVVLADPDCLTSLRGCCLTLTDRMLGPYLAYLTARGPKLVVHNCLLRWVGGRGSSRGVRAWGPGGRVGGRQAGGGVLLLVALRHGLFRARRTRHGSMHSLKFMPCICAPHMHTRANTRTRTNKTILHAMPPVSHAACLPCPLPPMPASPLPALAAHRRMFLCKGPIAPDSPPPSPPPQPLAADLLVRFSMSFVTISTSSERLNAFKQGVVRRVAQEYSLEPAQVGRGERMHVCDTCACLGAPGCSAGGPGAAGSGLWLWVATALFLKLCTTCNCSKGESSSTAAA